MNTLAEGISLNELARRLGKAKSGLHGLAARGQIPRLPSGKFDEAAVREALARNLEQSRAKPPKPVHRSHETSEQVNSGEQPGVESASSSFTAARTEDARLRSDERRLKLAKLRGELVPLAAVMQHVEKAFIGIRRSVQRMPSRHASEMAAALGCDPSKLDALLSKMIASELDEMSAPVVRS